jgi:hypothetical protein
VVWTFVVILSVGQGVYSCSFSAARFDGRNSFPILKKRTRQNMANWRSSSSLVWRKRPAGAGVRAVRRASARCRIMLSSLAGRCGLVRAWGISPESQHHAEGQLARLPCTVHLARLRGDRSIGPAPGRAGGPLSVRRDG